MIWSHSLQFFTAESSEGWGLFFFSVGGIGTPPPKKKKKAWHKLSPINASWFWHHFSWAISAMMMMADWTRGSELEVSLMLIVETVWNDIEYFKKAHIILCLNVNYRWFRALQCLVHRTLIHPQRGLCVGVVSRTFNVCVWVSSCTHWFQCQTTVELHDTTTWPSDVL